MPAPATMKAAQVEMLYDPDASPPVPTTSMASGGAATFCILARMVVTAPVISSTVSPRRRRPINSPPICDGVASPDIMWSKALADSSRVSVAPVATLPMSALKSSMLSSVRLRTPAGLCVPRGGKVEKILQDRVAVLRRDALRVKLHPMHRQRLVRGAHHQTVAGLGGDGEFVRQRPAIDHKRMIARRLERPVDAA